MNNIDSLNNDNNDSIDNTIIPTKDSKSIDNKKFGKRLSHSQKLIIQSKVNSNIPITQIAKEESVSPVTIYNVVKQSDYPVLEHKQLKNLQKSIISHAYANAFQATKSVTQEKMDSSSLVQLGVYSKISVELARLLEEKATSNIAIHNLNENINDELENLRRKIINLDNNPTYIDHSPSKRTINNNEEDPIEIKNISDENQKKV